MAKGDWIHRATTAELHAEVRAKDCKAIFVDARTVAAVAAMDVDTWAETTERRMALQALPDNWSRYTCLSEVCKGARKGRRTILMIVAMAMAMGEIAIYKYIPCCIIR
jgi:hypothetical protein